MADTGMRQVAGKCQLAKFGLDLLSDWSTERRDRETEWRRCRSDYLSEFRQLRKVGEGEGWRSRATPDTARQKVTAGVYLITDHLLQSGRVPFALQPSRRLLRGEPNAREQYKEAIAGEQARIDDQFSLCKADRELMLNIWDCALVGESWAQQVYATAELDSMGLPFDGPTKETALSAEAERDAEGADVFPAWKRRSFWNVFADPEAWDDPRRGRGLIYRDHTCPYDMRQRIGSGDFWLDANIKAAIEDAKEHRVEHTSSADESLPPDKKAVDKRKGKTVQDVECWVRVPSALVEGFERARRAHKGPGPIVMPEVLEIKDDGNEEWCLLQIYGDYVVRFARIVPEDIRWAHVYWQHEPDEPLPRGVARNARSAHDGVAWTIRAIEDCKAWTGNPMGILLPHILQGKLPTAITPGMLLHGRASVDDARKAFLPITIPDVGDAYWSLEQFWQTQSDWSTNLPKLTQGMVEKNAATATEIVEQSDHSEMYRGNVIRNFDEQLVEPMVNFFLRANGLDDGDESQIPPEGFAAQALGFSIYKERTRRLAAFERILSIVSKLPEFRAEIKARGILEPIGKALNVDPAEFLLSQEERDAKTKEVAESVEARLQAALAELAVAREQSEIRLTDAKATSELAGAEATQRRTVIDEAKAVAGLTGGKGE